MTSAELIPDLIGNVVNAIPPSRSQERKWSKEVRHRLAAWVKETAAPFLACALEKDEPEGEVQVEDFVIFVRYVARAPYSEYVVPVVKLEFGGAPQLNQTV